MVTVRGSGFFFSATAADEGEATKDAAHEGYGGILL